MMLTVHVKLLFFPSPSPSIIIHFITWLHATLKPKIFTWCGKIHAEVSRFLVLHGDCQTKIWIQHTVYSISQQWHLPGHDGAPRSSTAIFTFFLRSDSCFILEGTRRKRAQKLCIVRLFFFLIMVSRACFVLFWIQCFEFNLRFTKNTAFWKTGNVQRSSPVTMKWSAMGSSSAVSSPRHF